MHAENIIIIMLVLIAALCIIVSLITVYAWCKGVTYEPHIDDVRLKPHDR